MPLTLAPQAPAAALPPARILLVDDVPTNLLALEAALEPVGALLVKATSGEEALRHLLQEDFALILMDVQMPGLSGLETAQLVRQRERTRHVPIMFITALSREAAHVMTGYAHGAVDYLLKPVDPEVLRAKVRVFVELHQAQRAAQTHAVQLAEARAARAQAERAQQLEQQLMAVVGHDVRTPLTAMTTAAGAQLRRQDLDARARQAFERVLRGGQRIEDLVALMLDFTRARLGGGIPVVRAPGDLAALARAAVDEARAAHPGHAFELEVTEAPCPGSWDAPRLAQVLANLLDNAAKYGAPDAPVRLTLRRTRADAALLEVHNWGAPIPPDVMPLLFQPFERGARAAEQDAAAPLRQGLGLGLYIVHEVVRAHDGTLLADSSAEAGTTFRVCLPCEVRAPGEAPPCPPGAEPPSSQPA